MVGKFDNSLLGAISYYRAPVHLESCPGKDWPGSISSCTSYILPSFIILFYTLINNYLCLRESKSEDNDKANIKKKY